MYNNVVKCVGKLVNTVGILVFQAPFLFLVIFAIVAMILLNTLTVYEVSKWAVMSHHAKVWLDKKDEKSAQKKIFFLDNKILTKKTISFVDNKSFALVNEYFTLFNSGFGSETSFITKLFEI